MGAARRRPRPIRKARELASKVPSLKVSIPKLTGHFIPIKKPHAKRHSKFSLLQPRIKRKLSVKDMLDANNGVNKDGIILDQERNIYVYEKRSPNPFTGTTITIRREWHGPDPRAVIKDIADPTFGLRSRVTKTVKFRGKGIGKTSEKVFERLFDEKGKPYKPTIERKAREKQK